MRRSPTGFNDTLLFCHTALYRYARSLSRDPAEAEELVQETYRKALSTVHRPVPSTEENTRAWLFTVLRNLWHNELRRRNRWESHRVLLSDIPFAAEAVDAQVIRTLLQSEVRDAIDALPEPYREVVLLRDVEGMSYSQIAMITGSPAGTVMSRLARARASLRRSLSAPDLVSSKIRGATP